jgi:hypothetical protein
MRTAAYVYTGWHPVPERDAAFHPGFTEWELVQACRPRFPGHAQPKVPALGEYDDRDPAALGARIGLAHAHGVDAFVFGVFWCRGKRVFEDGLDRGFLGGPLGATVPFACMWSNRMVLAPERLVASDVDDFVAFVAMLAERYFVRSNHVTVEGRSYLSIYDSTFFVNELGVAGARDAIAAARAWLREHGHRDIHLAAIEPNAAVLPLVREVGFDSVTHYVLLPDWKGPFVQDYREQAELRARQWRAFGERSGLPYMPAVATGWDASPRGADFGELRPDKYPWWPVVTGEHPEHFAAALARARAFRSPRAVDDPLVLIASLNEWSEGHYLEPDERFGTGWLEAVRATRN